MPLLTSKKVGAAVSFLEDGKNGYLFEVGNHEQIKNLLQKKVFILNKQF
jgi:hypothetical protein